MSNIFGSSSDGEVSEVNSTSWGIPRHGRKVDIMYNNAGLSGKMDSDILSSDEDNFNPTFEFEYYDEICREKREMLKELLVCHRFGGILSLV